MFLEFSIYISDIHVFVFVHIHVYTRVSMVHGLTFYSFDLNYIVKIW